MSKNNIDNNAPTGPLKLITPRKKNIQPTLSLSDMLAAKQAEKQVAKQSPKQATKQATKKSPFKVTFASSADEKFAEAGEPLAPDHTMDEGLGEPGMSHPLQSNMISC